MVWAAADAAGAAAAPNVQEPVGGGASEQAEIDAQQLEQLLADEEAQMLIEHDCEEYPPRLHEGDRVALHSLSGQHAYLNGQCGTLRQFVVQTGKWAVSLDNGKRISIFGKKLSQQVAQAVEEEGQASVGSKRSSVPALCFDEMGPARVCPARVQQMTAQVKPVVAVRLDGSPPTVMMSTKHCSTLQPRVPLGTAEK